MGKKSRQKHQRTGSNATARSTTPSAPASTVRSSGVTLAALNQASAQSQRGADAATVSRAVNVSYEMVGTLRRDIRKITVLLATAAVILAALTITQQKTSVLNRLGERAATFLRLRG